jgi:DNA repair exonuclease SbcCD ATPase subunit
LNKELADLAPSAQQPIDDWIEEAQALGRLIREGEDLQAQWSRYLGSKETAERQLAEAEVALKSHQLPEDVRDDALQQAADSVKTLQYYAEDATVKLAVYVTQIEGLQRAIGALDQTLQDGAERLAQLQQYQKRGADCKALTAFLRKNRDGFMQESWESLLSYASAFISAASGGEMTALQRDEDGDFRYVENGASFPIEGASGMQSAILGVALKLALGAAIGGMPGLLLLDEVTAAGSPENSATLVQLLKQQAEQIILITHREADAALADLVIEL